MFADTNHFKLYYQVEGKPKGSTLVFINSLGCNLHIWDAVTSSFMNKYHVIRYDKRGHGLSAPPPGPYTIHDHAHDLAALLDHLEIKDAVLVGISVGGLIAMDFALHHPSRARALVLCDTAPKIAAPEVWEKRIADVRERGLDGMAETIVSRWFLPSFPQKHPDLYHQALEMLSHNSLEGYTSTCAAIRDTDLSSSVKSISAPVLALCGAGDLVVTPDQTREWAASLPNVCVDVINEAAHLPCIEQPDAVAKRIKRFLKEEL